MLREIDNYYYFIRQVEIMDDTNVLKQNKLKRNDKHSIYGAINLPPELLLYNNEKDLEQLEKTFFGNEMVKISDVFVQYDIIELYHISYERVKTDDYYAFVFNINYKWNHCNPRSIVAYSIAIALLVAAVVKLGIMAIGTI